MLSFKEFLIKEETGMHIDADPDILNKQVDTINDELDKITEKPFVNSSIFHNSVRGTLERFGIILPAESYMPMLSLEGENIYSLGDTDYYLYIVHNPDDAGSIEGYAQVVTQEELNDLEELDEDEDEEESPVVLRRWVPPARKDDDSGNTNEYS